MLACQRFENNNALQIIIKNSFEIFFSVLEKSIKSEEKMRLQYKLSFTIFGFYFIN